MKSVLSLIRHGHVDNPNNVLYGRLPGFRLSGKGREQARSAAAALRQWDLAAIFSSPLLRARQTAREILRYHPGLKLKISSYLNEIYTPFEGLPAEVVDKRRGDVYTGTASPFEQPADIVRRVLKFAARAFNTFPKRHIAAVTHGDIIVFMILWACGQPLTPAGKQNLAPFGITDQYPAPGSITTFTFPSASPEARPAVSYLRPY